MLMMDLRSPMHVSDYGEIRGEELSARVDGSRFHETVGSQTEEWRQCILDSTTHVHRDCIRCRRRTAQGRGGDYENVYQIVSHKEKVVTHHMVQRALFSRQLGQY